MEKKDNFKNKSKETEDLDLSLTMQQKFNFDSNGFDEEDTKVYGKIQKNKNLSMLNQKMKEILEIKNKYKRKSTFFFILFIIMILVSISIIIYYNMNPKVKIKTIEKQIVPENIVFLGDSITEGYDLEKYYDNNFFVVNSGKSGDKTSDILNNMKDRVYQYNPSKVVILVGTNDLESQIGIDETVNNIKQIVKEIKKNRSNTRIYIESIYPINNTNNSKINHNMVGTRTNEDIKETNNKLKQYCIKNNIIFIDIFSQLLDKSGNLNVEYTKDGLHLSDEGYKVITKKLLEYL